MADRERLYRTQAVVLRRLDLGEADRLLTLLTPRLGKLRAVAKGIRRPGSKKAGHLEPFSRVDLLLARGRELDIITQAEALDTYPHLQADLLRLAQTASIAELMDRFAMEQEPNPELYALLVDMLEQLNHAADPVAVIRYFQIHTLNLTGFRPELFQCVSCGRELQAEDQYFSVADGGAVCPRCGSSHRQAAPISLAALKVLRFYLRNSFAAATKPSVRPEVADEVEALLEGYLNHLLERRLQVPDFVRDVRQLRERRG